MRQSKLFTRTTKELPKDEPSFNAQALIRAGFVDKLAAGVYSFLPLGWRVINKIKQIVVEEMEAIGGQELSLPALAPKDNWLATERWDTLDVLFKIQASDNKEYVLNPTHEEVVTPLIKKFALSYKELPLAVFQIQTKFRNEKRAKSGLLRGREFLMKDLYSFHTNQADLDEYYEQAIKAYLNIYQRLGLGEETYLTFASGSSFSKYSHEFQTLTEAGEDTIYLCDDCRLAINEEIIAEQSSCPSCGRTDLRSAKAAEVGNIFKLGTRYSQAFDFQYQQADGQKKLVEMGCYGLGISRLLGTIVEVSHDDRGIIWPESIAPFKVHLLSLQADQEAEKIYQQLKDRGLEVLYDDRALQAGAKFADADLIGCPYRVVLSPKTLEAGKLELKKRNEETERLVTFEELIKILSEAELC